MPWGMMQVVGPTHYAVRRPSLCKCSALIHGTVFAQGRKTTAIMRLVLFSLCCLLTLIGSAQRIENASRSTTGYINADGRIENASRSTVGYINSNGRIENASRSTIGYISYNGRIENSSRSTVGYVNKDGRVENSSRSTIGYVNSDGRVENSSRSTIGYAAGVPREWAAVFYFFFSFE